MRYGVHPPNIFRFILIVFAVHSLALSVKLYADDEITVPIFGKVYTRSHGQPVPVADTLPLPSQAHEPFTLVVGNGTASGQNRVSSATIQLNGNQILEPSDFNQTVASLTRDITPDITLGVTNTLTVELRSQPGSFLSVTITGAASPDTTVTAASAQVSTGGGKVTLPNFATLSIPPNAISSGTVQLATVTSPLVDLLGSQAAEAFTLADLPTLQIQASTLFTEPVGLKISSPDLQAILGSSQAITFVALTLTGSLDEPSAWNLIQIGGTICGNNDAVCIFVHPELFSQSTPQSPWTLDVALAIKTSVPDPLPSTALWQVSNITPSPATLLQLGPSDTLTVSADFELTTNNLTFANVLAPFLPRPSCGSLPDLGYTCVKSPFGFRTDPRPEFHPGVDLTTQIETSQGPVATSGFLVFSAAAGSAQLSKNSCGIVRVGVDNGQSLSTAYLHLESGLGTFPRSVGNGEPIALSDNTGSPTWSTAAHLHFEARIDGKPVDPVPLLLNNLSLYVPYDLCISVDSETLGCVEVGQTAVSASLQGSPDTLKNLGVADGKVHILSLLLRSSRFVADYDLVDWQLKVVQPSNVGVHLNPFGNKNISDGPFTVQAVDKQLNAVAAPQDITVTLLREVNSACRGTIFSSNRTVLIPQGQSFATFDEVAGRDPFCNTLPITTTFTVLQATIQGKTLDLSFVPPKQLSLAVTR